VDRTPLQQLERLGLLGTRALSVLGLGALMVLASMTLADGLLRWLLNQPIEGVRDIGAFAVAVAIACCLPVGLMERSNITIRVFENVAGRRAGRWADCVASLLVLGVMVAMAWQFILHAGKLARASETTWVLKLPVAPFWYAVALIMVLAVLVQLVVLTLDVGRLVHRSPARDAEGDEALHGARDGERQP
jgi:TRAP-type C4-dicarboxylate transport system permease small subunit